jgi:deoxyribodipyrimidine photo-lyase
VFQAFFFSAVDNNWPFMTIQQIHLSLDREARAKQIRELFPQLTGSDNVLLGGRAEALRALAQVDARAYANTRNHLDGKVSRLSPYFRHGVMTLREAAESVIASYSTGAYKFVFELAWRDYWRRVWAKRGDAIERDIEAPKVPLGENALPQDIVNAATGLACMDTFVRDLTETGYVHNHARMWFASYVVHHRKVKWQHAADWYVSELLDGDRASNHLSWQWVASTFSHKPYIFNRENLEKYSDGKLCANCPSQRACPFDASYEELSDRLFAGDGKHQSSGSFPK